MTGQSLSPFTVAGKNNFKFYEAIARDIHIRERVIAGDRYATAREMESIVSDPLAYYKQIEAIFIVRTGRVLRFRSAIIADEYVTRWAIEEVEKDVRYEAERATTAA